MTLIPPESKPAERALRVVGLVRVVLSVAWAVARWCARRLRSALRFRRDALWR